MSPPPLILASRSPQRRTILEQIGLEFDVEPADVEELETGPPEAVAHHNAAEKALAVARGRPEALVLGADTVVALEGRPYGKPANAEAAADVLRLLSGRTHQVYGGVALARGEEVNATVVVTDVTFRVLSEDEIDWYVARDEWRERAGGYAIQGAGAALIERIEGDYLNVVGLAVSALLDLQPDLLTTK